MPQLNSGSVLDDQPGAKLPEHLYHPTVLPHPSPLSGNWGYRKETILGENAALLFSPPAQGKEQPCSSCSSPTNSCFNLFPLHLCSHQLEPSHAGASSRELVPTGLPRGSGSAALPQTPHQLLFRGDSTLLLCIQAAATCNVWRGFRTPSLTISSKATLQTVTNLP